MPTHQSQSKPDSDQRNQDTSTPQSSKQNKPAAAGMSSWQALTHAPPAQRQAAVLQLQRQVGNRRLTQMIQRQGPGHQAEAQSDTPDEGTGGHVAHIGEFELRTFSQLLGFMHLGVSNMEDAMEDVEPHVRQYERADIWVSNVRDWMDTVRQQGDAPLTQFAAAQAEVFAEDFTELRDNLIHYKQRRIRDELRRARSIVENRRQQLEALEPQVQEQMRNAYLSNDTDKITEVVNLSSAILDSTLALQTLSYDLSQAIGSVRGLEIPPASRFVGILQRFNSVLSGINLLVSYTDPDSAPTEIGAAMTNINNLTTAFGTASTLLNLAPHIGLYCNLYLGPAVSVATARAQAIVQQYSRQWMQYDLAVGNNPRMADEPGGAAMFNFMMQVMYAGGPSDIPAVPSAVREYLLDHREMLDIGAGSEMPTTGWWFWRDVDDDRIKSWVYSSRRQLWAMFYGNIDVPPAGTRARD